MVHSSSFSSTQPNRLSDVRAINLDVLDSTLASKVLKSGCGRRNGGGDAVAVAGCKGRCVTVAVTGTVNFFIFCTI